MILLRFWKESLLLLAVVALFGLWRAREHALVESGRNAERARVADSALSVLRPALARTDTILVRGKARVDTLLARVDTLRDSIPVWQHDTTYIKTYVERTDTALSACQALAGSCAAFRVTANQTIAALEQKLAIPPAPRSCLPTGVVGALLGAGAGFLGGKIAR